jgi:hypothetical protein
MRPTPEQIEKAGYWFNKNIRARKTVEQLSTAYVLAAYAAHCVAEAVAEKDAEIARFRAAIQSLLDCPDIADNDHKDEETHEAERKARAALQEMKP